MTGSCHDKSMVSCYDKSILYKTDVVRDLFQTHYSRVSFAVQRMKWKLHLPRVSMQFLSERWVLRPPDTRFTQTHSCTFVSLSCPLTEQLAPQCQLTPRIIPSNLAYYVLDSTRMPHFQSVTFSLPQWYNYG